MDVSQSAGVVSYLEYGDIGDGEHSIRPIFNGGVRRRYSIDFLHVFTTDVRCVQSDAKVAHSSGLVSNIVFQGVLKNPKDIAEFPSDILQRRPVSKAWELHCLPCYHLLSS